MRSEAGCVLVAVVVAGMVAGSADRAVGGGTPPRSRTLLPVAEEAAPAPRHERVQVLVELSEAPAAKVWAEQREAAGKGRLQVSATAARAARSQLVQVEAEQLRMLPEIEGARIGAQVIFRVGKVLNGISAYVAPDRLDAIRALAGVKAVHIVEPEYPTAEPEAPASATSVPFTRNPQVWTDTLGLGMSLDGAGITIGIIDSGIDYQHAGMGGAGLLAEYQANDRAVAPDAYFPTAKVVGGHDFAGDLYTGSNVPVPDSDPMDCMGHGSHVAGIAGGLGVNADGTPYAGPWGPGTPFASLRIGPGTAPRAELYALRVFGCGGATGLSVAAIEWAMDPDGDGDLSDHLDVINLSLGSRFGRASNTTAMAAENAALAGVVVVCAAGNEGDAYFVTGSPGVATRAISVANTLDDGLPAVILTVGSPAAIAGSYPAGRAGYTDANTVPQPAGETGTVVVALDPADVAGPLTRSSQVARRPTGGQGEDSEHLADFCHLNVVPM